MLDWLPGTSCDLPQTIQTVSTRQRLEDRVYCFGLIFDILAHVANFTTSPNFSHCFYRTVLYCSYVTPILYLQGLLVLLFFLFTRTLIAFTLCLCSYEHRNIVSTQCQKALLMWHSHSFLLGLVKLHRMCHRELPGVNESFKAPLVGKPLCVLVLRVVHLLLWFPLVGRQVAVT